MPSAAELQSQANDEGLDMMAWGVPGMFISPGYYEEVAELRELFRMMNEGLEGHAERLKECRESWDTTDLENAREFSQLDPEGLGDSIDWGGDTFTEEGNDVTWGPASVVDGDSWTQAPTKAVTGGHTVYGKVLAVGRADDAGEMLNAVSDLAASTAAWGNDMVSLATNPLSFLVSAGLDFLISLIQPVDDALGMVTGNGERMTAEINRWEGIKDGLPPIGEAIAKIPEGMISEWSGEDGDLAREKIKEFAESVFELGDMVQVLQGLMQLCELIATLIRKTLLNLISKWVTKQITQWAAATAASTFTFGGAAAAQMANSIRSALQTTVNAMQKYKQAADTFMQAHSILSKVARVLSVAAKPLSEAGFKTVGMVGTLAGSGGPNTNDIADGFNG